MRARELVSRWKRVAAAKSTVMSRDWLAINEQTPVHGNACSCANWLQAEPSSTKLA